MLKWFWAIFFVTQTKKGISGWLLSKQIEVSESTARLMLSKIRAEMEENSIEYQIGGSGTIVELDEFEIGGVGNKKQILADLNTIVGNLKKYSFSEQNLATRLLATCPYHASLTFPNLYRIKLDSELLNSILFTL